MAYDGSPIPWTDDQWGRIEDVIQQEARSARVAASFLPLFGPLPRDADFVRRETIADGRRRTRRAPATPATIADTTTVPLATLQVMVVLRGAQIADPELESSLQLFRRAANLLARLEDLVVFRGLNGRLTPRGNLPQGDWQITGGQRTRGLWSAARTGPVNVSRFAGPRGNQLARGVSDAIGLLESAGHFGPFAVVLGQTFFEAVQTPAGSLVLPQDRIIPFLEGGPLLRSSALRNQTGVVVALGGAPVDLVVARDVSVDFLNVTNAPAFRFRVFEKIVLRVKQRAAICRLEL
jgi:uncharacterized linocin/CFP29 family protein